MGIYLYIATAIGLFIAAQTDGQWHIVKHSLKEQSLTSVAVTGNVILAGSRNGIWRSADNGQTWTESNRNLGIRYVRWMTSSATPSAAILVGTEPAGIFVSRDSGITWNPNPEVSVLRDKYGWFLPYSPNAGCVRGFAIAESGPRLGRVYAAVEVGGVLVSDDGGEEWRLVEGSDGKPDLYREFGTMIHPDVHSIAVHPMSSDIVTAATGGGLYRSIDGGRTWNNIYDCYIRAIWVDPNDAHHIIAGPADGVSRNGRIEESFDGGRNWKPASEGMKVPWPRHMVDRFVQVGDDLFAILSNGELRLKPLKEVRWQRVLPEIARIEAMAASR
ncbi:MAG: hypothetical protein PVH85_27410 [Desulfobacterales bacterium]|jgi:hypothetical protein